MPGLITSSEYSLARASACCKASRLDEVLDALEWELTAGGPFESYPLVAVTPRGEVRYHQVEATEHTPGAAVTFGLENFNGTRKFLLLDAWQPESDPDL